MAPHAHPTRLAVFLHATEEPDYVTEDVETVRGVVGTYGAYSDILVVANDLAKALEHTPIRHYLANTEESSMVRLVLT